MLHNNQSSTYILKTLEKTEPLPNEDTNHDEVAIELDELPYHTEHKLNVISEQISPPPTWSSYLAAGWPKAKLALLYIAGVATALPPAFYALILPLNIPPSEFSLELFSSMPAGIKALSIILAAVTLGIGTLMRVDYIPRMISKLKDLFSQYCTSVANFFSTNFILMMSGIAALATLALGYNAFDWHSVASAAASAAVSFLLTLGMRAISMAALKEKLGELFYGNHQFQKDIVEELKRIKPEHVAEFEKFLKSEVENGRDLNEDLIRECLLNIYDKAYSPHSNTIAIKTVEIFKPKSEFSKCDAFFNQAVNFSLGAFIGTSFLLFFSQNGYVGIEIILNTTSEIINSDINLDIIPYGGQLAIALLTGASSGILGFLSGMEVTANIQDAKDLMHNNPGNKAKVISATIGSAISATSLAGAVKVMTDQPNLFNISTRSFSGILLIGGNWALATVFDLHAILDLISKNHPSHQQVISWLNKNKLSEKTISALKNHGYFKPVNNNNVSDGTKLLEQDKYNYGTLTTRLIAS